MTKNILAALMMIGMLASQAHALTFDSGVPQGLQTQMNGDLQFVGTIAGSKTSALHQQIYGEVKGSAYSTWFTSRVLRVGYDSSGAGGAVAYVQPGFDSSKMYVTSNYTTFDHPQIARLMVVFHEARHTENRNGNWPHATCPEPFLDDTGKEVKSIWTGLPLAGQDGCDDSAFGAYGSSTIMLRNVAHFCTSCSDKVKMDAGIYSDDQLNRLLPAEARNQIKQDVPAIR